MPRASTKRKPVPAWDLPPGYFLEPVLRWFPDFRARPETHLEKRGRTNLLIGISTSAVRDRALANGEWWAQGFLGQLSARPLKIDPVTSKRNAVAGMKQTSTRKRK